MTKHTPNPLEIARTTGASLANALPDLYVQRNPKFAEGSMPGPEDERAPVIDALLKGALGLDPKTTFKVGMDGMVMGAGGLIVLYRTRRGKWRALLASKGDIYNKGKTGVIGGQGKDADHNNPLASALRESGEEIGAFPFKKERLIELLTTREWRTVDSRGEYGILATFYVYVATEKEVTAMRASYARHVEATGGDPEIAGLRSLSIRELLTFIKEGRIGYYDQTQAFVMTALCLSRLRLAGWMVENEDCPRDQATIWRVARAISEPEFQRHTSNANGDWRPKLDVDTICEDID